MIVCYYAALSVSNVDFYWRFLHWLEASLTNDSYKLTDLFFLRSYRVQHIFASFLFLVFRTSHIFLDTLLQITKRSGALRQKMEVKVLQVEIVTKFFRGIFSEVNDFQLTNHVGSSLSWTALVSRDFFPCGVARVPGVISKVTERFSARETFVM